MITQQNIETRVEALLQQMTLEEKVSQLVHHSKAIEKLNIKTYNWWNECLHGVARAGLATVFPQAIGMAASWNTQLIYEVATVISDEARAKHHEFERLDKRGIYQGLTHWSPNINIFRDPRWGRGMETYGEDPFLTSRLAVAYIKGLQGDDPEYFKVIATPKHFAVHSGPEYSRHYFNVEPSARDLWETYLPAFEASIKEAGAYSIMGAYNRLYDEACCASTLLLHNILREQWSFRGFVVSDCGAIHDIFAHHKLTKSKAEAAALAVKSGTDLCCGNEYCDLVEAVYSGLISEADINIVSRRLLRAKMKLGMFDAPEKVAYAAIPFSVVDCKVHKAMALQMSRESIVLLKNENDFLPLEKNIPSIAVIGPNADNNEIILGNYHGSPSSAVSLYQGIVNKLGSSVNIVHERGCELAEGLPFFDVLSTDFLFTDAQKNTQGLLINYYNNKNLEGLPAHTEIVADLNHQLFQKLAHKITSTSNFSIGISGHLFVPQSGQYAIGIAGLTSFQLFLNDSLLTSFNTIWEPEKVYEIVSLKTGELYKILIEIKDLTSEAHVQKLLWAVPDETVEERALHAAATADVVVLAMGLSPQLEGEEMPVKVDGFKQGDRLDINLPVVQESFLKKIVAIGKPVVLVLFNGCSIAVNFANKNVAAIIEAWYGGQSAGDAVADVLFGDYNPSGRLPLTFYQSVNQLPAFDDYSMEGRTYRYFKGETLYDFGFGLSYSQFIYANLICPDDIEKNISFTVKVDVENISARDGAEVVQLYVNRLDGSSNYPIRSLQGFCKIFLMAGEHKTVEFELTPQHFAYVNEAAEKKVEQGGFQITVGGYQPTNDLIEAGKFLFKIMECREEISFKND